MKKVFKIIITLLLTLIPLTGCSKTKGTITVTCYPVQYIVEQLVGDTSEVVCLSKDMYIQTTSIKANYDDILKDSDVLIYISELEPYMSEYAEKMHNYHLDVIDLASLSSVCNFCHYQTNVIDGTKIVKETPYYDDPLFEDVLTYQRDPYIWLEPIATSSMALTIKEYLCSKYPENTLVYEKNFNSLQAKLVRMDIEYQSIKSLNVKFVSICPNFGIWQKSYGVSVYPVVTSKDGSIPTDEQLNYIVSVIKENKIKYIVNDPTLPDVYQELYKKVVEMTSLKPIVISSLSILSTSDIELNKDYITIMYENLTAIEKIFK